MATMIGPKFSPAAFLAGGPPAATSVLGPISCNPCPLLAAPCVVLGAARPDGSPFTATPFGTSGFAGGG
eukprot:6937310-Heterocapsa_arctica.AAC.1